RRRRSTGASPLAVAVGLIAVGARTVAGREPLAIGVHRSAPHHSWPSAVLPDVPPLFEYLLEVEPAKRTRADAGAISGPGALEQTPIAPAASSAPPRAPRHPADLYGAGRLGR